MLLYSIEYNYKGCVIFILFHLVASHPFIAFVFYLLSFPLSLSLENALFPPFTLMLLIFCHCICGFLSSCPTTNQGFLFELSHPIVNSQDFSSGRLFILFHNHYYYYYYLRNSQILIERALVSYKRNKNKGNDLNYIHGMFIPIIFFLIHMYGFGFLNYLEGVK